jgi:hypothetical protein
MTLAESTFDAARLTSAAQQPGLTQPDGRSTFSLWFTGGIFVDADGRRFVNEPGPYDRWGLPSWTTSSAPQWNCRT